MTNIHVCVNERLDFGICDLDFLKLTCGCLEFGFENLDFGIRGDLDFGILDLGFCGVWVLEI